ncbi:MAG: hypothetical protein ACK5RL_12470 [Acidimicrobiales bacterium]
MSRSERDSRLIEVMAVVLLALSTVASAWCAYQSTRWNGEEATLARESTDDRVEATRLFSFGTQTVAYDSSIASAYAEAYVNGDVDLQNFYRNVLARPEFVPVLDEWASTAEAGDSRLGSLLTDEDYLAGQLAGYEEAMAASDAAANEAGDAGQVADRYIVLTLVLAGALFFAGVTSSFRSRAVQLALLTMAGVLVAFTVGQLVDLPVV